MTHTYASFNKSVPCTFLYVLKLKLIFGKNVQNIVQNLVFAYNRIKYTILGGIQMAINAYTVSDFRENIKAITDDVFDYNETVIITRPKKRNVVMISEAEYNSWQETLHLLGTAANRDALATSLKQLENQNTHVLTPEDWAKMQLQDEDGDE